MAFPGLYTSISGAGKHQRISVPIPNAGIAVGLMFCGRLFTLVLVGGRTQTNGGHKQMAKIWNR